MRSSQSLGSIRGGFDSFFNELDTGKELCSDSVSCLHKLETKNYACYKFACPQHNDAKRGTCPPSFIAFNKVDGMKVHFRDLGKTRLVFDEVLITRLDLERELFHFLMTLAQ